jgi:anti-sigma B factor antagonist
MDSAPPNDSGGVFSFTIRGMALAIAHRDREGIEILDLDGRLVFGEEDLQFRNEIDKLLRARKNRVVLNLARLAEIDTTGLGTLLFALAKLRKEGGGLALVNLRSSHIELLELTKLETVFEVFDDEQEAINSFFPGREVRRYDILEFVLALRKKKAK